MYPFSYYYKILRKSVIWSTDKNFSRMLWIVHEKVNIELDYLDLSFIVNPVHSIYKGIIGYNRILVQIRFIKCLTIFALFWTVIRPGYNCQSLWETELKWSCRQYCVQSLDKIIFPYLLLCFCLYNFNDIILLKRIFFVFVKINDWTFLQVKNKDT